MLICFLISLSALAASIVGTAHRIISQPKSVVDVAKERNIPIRVGVNSGSLEKDLVEKYHGVYPQQAVC